MGVDLATYRARIGCFQNPTPRSARCWSQASALLVGVILAQLWDKVMGDGQGKVVSSPSDKVLPALHQTEVQTYQLHCQPQSRCCYVMMFCLLVWFMMAWKLLLLAGDIEQNPGPTLRETEPDTDEIEEQSLTPRKNDDDLLELDLSGRNMSSVPNQVFQQNNIQVLNFQRNSIKVIPMDIGMLFQLRHLDISCNKLSHLPDSISSLSNLEELNITGNTIQEFPKGMENMQALKVLIYRNNSLVAIPEEVFYFPIIEELDISDNELSEVSPLIGNLLSLKVLNLRWNQSLQTLPQELCQLSNLEDIDLSVCDIGCLPDDIGNLRKLKTFKLSCNRISSLPASVFQGLGNLEELDLCDNSITEITESISNLNKLKSLKVADNQLTRLPTSIVQLTELQTLNVGCNSIYDLPNNFEDLVKIVYLNLKHNQISRVPFLSHGAFPALQELNLTGNPIQLSESQLVNDLCNRRRATVCVDYRQYVHLIKQKDESSNYWRMKGNLVISLCQGYEINAADICEGYIDLSDAGLNALPHDFDIHDSSEIVLSHNRLEAFPVSSPVVGPSKLRVLDLSHNLLSALPEEIHFLSNLTILNVPHNKLHSIPLGVYELLSLETFDMSYNFVQQLPPTKFPGLKELDLSFNEFQKVPDAVLQTQSLTSLNLLGNDIRSFSADKIKLPNLKILYCDVTKLDNLSLPPVLKTMPIDIKWTVPNKQTSTDTETLFRASLTMGCLQVTTKQQVTKTEFDEQFMNELNCNIAWFKGTLRTLNMSNCNIQDLPEHIFFLSKLKKLDVSNNRLSSLPSKLVYLQNLQVLNVSNCSLNELPDSIGDFPSLTRLDVSRNNLKALPNTLSNLPRLETLSLHYCGCHQVQLLSNLASLRHVKVDLAQLISIRIHCLDEFSAAGTTISLIQRINRCAKNVISIDELRGPVLDITPSCVKSYPSHGKDSQPLTSISISHVDDPDILNYLLSILCMQNLQNLKVANCCLTALPDSLGDLHSLISLDISRNPLKTLPSTISHMSTLKVLNVSNCSLTALPDSLEDLQSLISLDISGNPLKTLPFTILHLSTLKVLDVSNCSLTVLPDSMGDFPSLTSLNISRNDIKILPNSISHLSTLEKLSMQYCGCHQVEFLSNLTSLRHVEVDVAQLICIRLSCLDELLAAGTSIGLAERTMFACHDIVKHVDAAKLREPVLDIDSWSIKTSGICPSFKDVQPLTSLSISHVSNAELDIADVTVVFSIDSLKVLKLSGCSLKTLPETIQHLSNLTHLDLSNNGELSNLPKGLGELKMLQKLKLSNCGLSTFLEPNAKRTQQLSNLTALDISNNILTTLSEGLTSLLSLTELDISLNCITDMMLPESMAKLSSLQRLTIFHCGCYQMSFLSELKQLEYLKVDFWQLVSIQQQTAQQLSDGVQIEVVLVHFDYKVPLDRIALEDLRHGVIHVKLKCCAALHNMISPPDAFKYNGDITKIDVNGDYSPNMYFCHDKTLTLNISVIHTLQELIMTNINFKSNPWFNEECPVTVQFPVNLTRLHISTCISLFEDNNYFFQVICQQSALQELKVSDCSIQCVSEEIGLLVNLTHLDLSKNWIEDLPDEICNITSLKWLCLQHNKLSSLPERIGNLLSLEYLDISFNKVISMPDSFRQLESINELKLFHCGCYQLEFLPELKQLKYLTVDFWQLVSIHWQTADQLPHSLQIKSVYLNHETCHVHCKDGKDIPTVVVDLDELQHGVIQLQYCHDLFFPSPPDIFKYEYCGDVIKMDLSGSNFKNKTLKLGFSDCHTLLELKIAFCNVNDTSHETELLHNLIQLDISYNESRYHNEDFPEFIFNQSSLSELNMSNCKLICVTEKIGQLVSLTHLDLSRNNIRYLPDELCSISSLRWLSLQYNELSSLPVGIGNLLALEYLDVSSNRLSKIPDSFKTLNCMNELKLFHCGCYHLGFLSELKQLQDLTVDIWQLVSIERQTAGQLPSFVQINVIYIDCETYGEIYHKDKELKDVHLPSVKIKLKELQHGVVKLQCCEDSFILRPPDDFKYSGDIIKMDLSGSKFDKNIVKIDVIYITLQELNMSNCQLNHVEKIGLLVNLTHLDLSRNNIRYLPDELCSLSSLKCLSLWGNQLSSLPAMIDSLLCLEYLNVMFNRITNLPQSFRQLSSMNELKLSHCGCYQVDFLLELKQLKDLTVDFWQLVSIPRHIAGQLSDSLQIRAIFLDHEKCHDLYYMNENSIPSVIVALEDLQCGLVKLKCCHDLFILNPPKDFKYHGDIIKMDLSESRFNDDTILNIGIIHTLQELSVAFSNLDLTSCKIQLPGKLTWLNISCNNHNFYNDINGFPEFICQQSALQELNISNCKVGYVTEKIGQLVSLTHLDVSRNKIECLPDELCNITSLRWLSLHNNRLSRLPVNIAYLLSLEYLDISLNRFNSVPDSFEYLHHLKHLNLSNNSIDSIPLSICRLQHLQTIDVSVNSIKELPENIGDFSSLRVLNVGTNYIKELPESFTGLVNLTSLNFSSNNLIALPDEMFEFVNLIELNIAGNQIDTLPNTICELQNLEYLRLENNSIRVLPIQFGKLHKLHHFGKEQIHGNPIEQPPIEVFEQGLEGVVAYFEELKLSKPIEVPRVKALLLGEVAAGKTSLCNAIRLGQSNLTDITDRTAGIEVHPARLQDSLQVLMHDFGGHKIYHLTHQFFFSKVALYLIVVDLEAFMPSSFDAAVKYWLNVIKARIDSKPVLRIVATHIDRCKPEEIKQKAELITKKTKQIEKVEVVSLKKHLSEIDDALNKAGKPLGWCYQLEGFNSDSLKERKKSIEHLIDNRPIFPEHIDLVSCDLNLDGVKNLIEKIVTTCEDHRLFPRRILPTSWYELERAIKTLKQDGQLGYLNMNNVKNVALEKANMTSERLTRALKYLHDIGEIVHFADSPKLSDFVFHKPQWLMDVFKLVYKPVDRYDERFADVSDADFDDMVEDFSTRGLVSKQMLQCLWKDMNLSDEEETMLIRLLQKFDLCFVMPPPEVADEYTTGPGSVSPVYRFPWLLTASAPSMPSEISSDEDKLMVVFQLQNYCPVGLFETLSVKLNKFIKYRKDWQYGIHAVSVVEKNKFELLVQLEPKERSEEILISVRTQNKKLKEAWGVMVQIINATKELLQQWPGVLYCVRVVCPHCLKRGEDKPHRFSGAVLDKAPRGIVVCPKTWEEIDPRLIHPEISPAQLQQRRKRAKSPAPDEEIMKKKQPRYSEPEPGNSGNTTTLHRTHISKDCNAQNHADTANVWERFRSMSIEMQPGDEGNRLAAHLMESGLKLRPDVPKDGNCLFHAVSDQLVRTGSQDISHSQLRHNVVSYLREHPYNGQGDHLRAFVTNEDWEGYLKEMSQNGVWGDHIVLQALASMLGRDIRIVSSIDADNYTTILSPMGNQQHTTGPPVLLGHYAENHYASLDVCQRTAVLLVNDEYGTSKGGISTINLQLAQLLRRFGAVVYCTVLWVTTEDEEEARKDGVHLIRPSVQAGDTRKPSLNWLTYDHQIRYPNLPENVGYIVGHADITDKAAEKIKNSRYPQAKLFSFNHTIPEDTEHYKEDGKPLKAWEKEKELLKVADAADAVFSVGKRIYDHFETMYKGDKKPKTHHLFLPKPSKTFENTYVKPGGEQKVVLSIGRVKKVEKLKGHDLAARAIGKVAEVITNLRMRVRGINEDDYETSQRILEENLQSGRLKPTLLPYGTQREISDDMKTAHLVLMPSRSEPFGLVGLEALAAGIPVLISSQSGLADLIKELIKEEKCDPDLRHRIVETSVNVGDLDTDACKWSKEIEDTLRWNDEEFQKAGRFKQQLLKSKYWEESHQIFLQACGITNAFSS